MRLWKKNNPCDHLVFEAGYIDKCNILHIIFFTELLKHISYNLFINTSNNRALLFLSINWNIVWNRSCRKVKGAFNAANNLLNSDFALPQELCIDDLYANSKCQLEWAIPGILRRHVGYSIILMMRIPAIVYILMARVSIIFSCASRMEYLVYSDPRYFKKKLWSNY